VAEVPSQADSVGASLILDEHLTPRRRQVRSATWWGPAVSGDRKGPVHASLSQSRAARA